MHEGRRQKQLDSTWIIVALSTRRRVWKPVLA